MEDDYKSDHCFHTGCSFVKSGLWFFIIGMILGFAVLLHYIMGSSYDTSEQFLSNVTLWFGSPLTLSVGYLQIGGLAMAILGILHCWKAKCHTHCDTSNTISNTTSSATAHSTYSTGSSCCSGTKKTALTLCIIGMIMLIITGFIGYFTIDWIWPGFYYLPIMIGKNVWLVLQGLSILIFLVGFIMAACCCCKHKRDAYTQR